MDENTYKLAILRHWLMAICALVTVLALGYRFSEAQRVKLLMAAKDPMLAACALEQSATNTACAIYATKSKE